MVEDGERDEVYDRAGTEQEGQELADEIATIQQEIDSIYRAIGEKMHVAVKR